MNDAPFAAEIYGAWDFGPVIFEDVILASRMNLQVYCQTNRNTDCHWQRHYILHRVSLELQWCNKRQHHGRSVDGASRHCCL